MALIRPILNTITPFPSNQPYNFEFTAYGSDQHTALNLVVQKVSDNTAVYNGTADSFAFSHQINANILSDNQQYKAQIRIKNASGVWSDFSDWTLFYCFQIPIINITNLTDGVANNQNFKFIGSYTQENDPIKSFLFILYDENMIEIGVSPLTYSNIIEYTFTLTNQKKYFITLKCVSQYDVEVIKTVGFIASYIAPSIGAELVLTNLVNKGMIETKVIAKQINGEGTGYTFEFDEWINLKAVDAEVHFTDCFNSIKKDYSLKLHFKNIEENKIFLIITTSDGKMELVYYDKRFHVFKISKSTGLVGHFISKEDITFTSEQNICIELKIINNLIDIFASLYA